MTEGFSSFDQVLGELLSRFPIPEYIAPDAAAHRTVADVVTRHLQPGATLYDFGAGACDKTAVAQLLGIQCQAHDDLKDNWYQRGYSERIRNFARDLGIEFTETFEPPPPGTLDMVMLNDVLEHLHDSPREILTALVHGLRIGGYLFVSVPNLGNLRKRLAVLRGGTNLPRFDLYYWYEGPWRGPVREYVRDDLNRLCVNLGLELVEIRTADHMLGNLPSFARPIYRALARFVPGVRDTWVMVAKKPSGWTPRSLTDEEFATIYAHGHDHILHRLSGHSS